MYELITLVVETPDDSVTPEARMPFVPDRPLNNKLRKGLTYGSKLRIENESGFVLRNAVQECLYEMPRHRPTLVELKTRVTNVMLGIVERDMPDE